MDSNLKVLIVDDTAFMRKAVAQILSMDPGISVTGNAKNGAEAVEKVKELHPDVVTLDIDMPVMNGLTAAKHIMVECPVPIVVLSSLTNDGAVTFEALRLGVVDFVPKPSGAISTDIDRSKQMLIDRIKAAQTVNLENVRRVRLSRKWDRNKRVENLYGFAPLDYLVAVGTTLSGPNTVIRILADLPPTLPCSVVVIQEISPRIIRSFVGEFNEHVPWRVKVGEPGMELEQGCCYIASNENPVRVDRNSKGDPCLVKGRDEKSPLDDLYGSAAKVFGQNTLGVLLTGLGSDGAQGFREIRKARGITIAQDANCCVYPNLTANAIKLGVVDSVMDENNMADFIRKTME